MPQDEQVLRYEISDKPCEFPRNDAGTSQPEAVDMKCPLCGHQGMICDGKVVPHIDCPQCEARFCAHRTSSS